MVRFQDKYIPEPMSGCWIWIGADFGDVGYGAFHMNGKSVGAHRVSWLLHNGKIQIKMLVCHKCDNRLCVNPRHLFLGTHSDNSKDCARKNRCNLQRTKERPKGQTHSHAKLTNEDVLLIRNVLHKTMPTKEIALKYNIGKDAITRIINRKTWDHL